MRYSVTSGVSYCCHLAAVRYRYNGYHYAGRQCTARLALGSPSPPLPPPPPPGRMVTACSGARPVVRYRLPLRHADVTPALTWADDVTGSMPASRRVGAASWLSRSNAWLPPPPPSLLPLPEPGHSIRAGAAEDDLSNADGSYIVLSPAMGRGGGGGGGSSRSPAPCLIIALHGIFNVLVQHK